MSHRTVALSCQSAITLCGAAIPHKWVCPLNRDKSDKPIAIGILNCFRFKSAAHCQRTEHMVSCGDSLPGPASIATEAVGVRRDCTHSRRQRRLGGRVGTWSRSMMSPAKRNGRNVSCFNFKGACCGALCTQKVRPHIQTNLCRANAVLSTRSARYCNIGHSKPL